MKNKEQILRKILNILLSISILISGIFLMAGCVSIYSIGDQPYTRKIVLETFGKIATPIYICLALTILSFIVDFISPSKDKIVKNVPQYSYVLNRLNAKKDFSNCNNELLQKIIKERKSRKIHIVIRTTLICISIIIFLLYALNGNNYQNDINTSVIKAMWILTPCFLIPSIYSVFVSINNEKSIKKEIELVKKLETKDDANKSKINSNHKSVLLLRFIALFIGICFLIYGYFAGGTADVLTKAINICTECIGLG